MKNRQIHLMHKRWSQYNELLNHHHFSRYIFLPEHLKEVVETSAITFPISSPKSTNFLTPYQILSWSCIMHNCMAKSREDFVAQQKHGNSGYQDEL
jgi:hypothetical protein